MASNKVKKINIKKKQDTKAILIIGFIQMLVFIIFLIVIIKDIKSYHPLEMNKEQTWTYVKENLTNIDVMFVEKRELGEYGETDEYVTVDGLVVGPYAMGNNIEQERIDAKSITDVLSGYEMVSGADGRKKDLYKLEIYTQDWVKLDFYVSKDYIYLELKGIYLKSDNHDKLLEILFNLEKRLTNEEDI